jgi:hypothetical protein
MWTAALLSSELFQPKLMMRLLRGSRRMLSCQLLGKRDATASRLRNANGPWLCPTRGALAGAVQQKNDQEHRAHNYEQNRENQ